MFQQTNYGEGGLFLSLIHIRFHPNSKITSPKAWGIQLRHIQSQEAKSRRYTPSTRFLLFINTAYDRSLVIVSSLSGNQIGRA